MVIRLKVWPVDVLFDRKKQHKITPRIRYLFYMELILINMKEIIYRSQGEKASHYHAFFFCYVGNVLRATFQKSRVKVYKTCWLANLSKFSSRRNSTNVCFFEEVKVASWDLFVVGKFSGVEIKYQRQLPQNWFTVSSLDELESGFASPDMSNVIKIKRTKEFFKNY